MKMNCVVILTVRFLVVTEDIQENAFSIATMDIVNSPHIVNTVMNGGKTYRRKLMKKLYCSNKKWNPLNSF